MAAQASRPAGGRVARRPRTNGRSLHATILNIQRMSTEDGPGLRTTVFFKGCSLECAWCHNPEAICTKPQLVWYSQRCILARACDAACPEDAISHRGPAVEIVHDRCDACGDCARHCPSGALEVLGATWDLDDLVREVTKDSSYFEASGGGVTISGGEPALQTPFVVPFLERCRGLGLHTALDTCGMCSTSALLGLAARSDLVLFDLKEIDPAKHARITGQTNKRIVSNLAQLAAAMRRGELTCELWIRTPLVPGATQTEENIYGIGAYIASELADVVRRWELCAFNNLAADKYTRLGMTWQFARTPLLTMGELDHYDQVARRSGVDPQIVFATGPTRTERGIGAPSKAAARVSAVKAS